MKIRQNQWLLVLAAGLLAASPLLPSARPALAAGAADTQAGVQASGQAAGQAVGQTVGQTATQTAGQNAGQSTGQTAGQSASQANATGVAAVYQAKTPEIRVAPSVSSAKVGDTFQVAFWLQGFLGQYKGVEGVEFQISYDPGLVQPVLDGDSGTLAGGVFSESLHPITWSNLVDKKGTIKFAQSLAPQSSTGLFTGNGKIGVVTFRALKEGQAAFAQSDSIVIMPGNPGINIKHSYNSPTVSIGSAGQVADKLENKGDAPKAAAVRSPKDVIASFKDAAEFTRIPWSVEAVASLTEHGALKGLPDGSFDPRKNMTRAEFAQLAVVALGLDMQQRSEPEFSDVAPDNWYYDVVETAASYGLISGYTQGGVRTFKPDSGITRAEIASILSKYLLNVRKLPDKVSSSNLLFRDVTADHWAERNILNLYGYGIIQGVAKDRFAPSASATRAEVSVMVHKLLLLG